MSAVSPSNQSSAGSASAAGSWDREVSRFIEAGGNTTHSFGLGRLIGRIFAFLYLNPHPLSLEEIASRLKISKASASIVVRQLAGWQAIRQVWVPGDRRDFYEVETNFSMILKQGLLPGVRKKLESASVQVDRTLRAEPPVAEAADGGETLSRPEHQEIRKRLRAAQTLYRRVNRVLSSRLVERFI